MRNFFEHKAAAERRTRWLLVGFVLAIIAMGSAVFALAWLMRESLYVRVPLALRLQASLAIWPLYGWCLGSTAGIVGLASAWRIMTLREGGAALANMLGGRLVNGRPKDQLDRRLLNVVTEMAIAAGVPVPQVYVLDHEPGINAMAAGWRLSDAIIAVTHGSLEKLTRAELQGVIAHEYSHILHGDARLNLRLMGTVFGMLSLALLGKQLLRAGNVSRKNGAVVAVAGGVIAAVGYVGAFFGNLIKAAVSRQREYLADAAAVQFTRNPEGIAGALKKIGGCGFGARLINARAEEASHFFFGPISEDFLSLDWFATHPPLEDRIRLLDPSWNGKFMITSDGIAEPVAADATVRAFAPLAANDAQLIPAAAVSGEARSWSTHALPQSQPRTSWSSAARGSRAPRHHASNLEADAADTGTQSFPAIAPTRPGPVGATPRGDAVAADTRTSSAAIAATRRGTSDAQTPRRDAVAEEALASSPAIAPTRHGDSTNTLAPQETTATNPLRGANIHAPTPGIHASDPSSASAAAPVHAFHGARASHDASASQTEGTRAPLRASDVLDTVGTAGASDTRALASAREWLAERDPQLMAATESSFSACALVFALLLADEPELRARQLREVAGIAGPALLRETERLWHLVIYCDRADRLALCALAAPALRDLSREHAATLHQTAAALIAADGGSSLFENLLGYLLGLHHRPGERSFARRRLGLRATAPEAQLVLSALAHAGASFQDAAARAFTAASERLPDASLTLLAASPRLLSGLAPALDSLRALRPRDAARFVDACAHAVLADRRVTDEEITMLRAVCVALDAPLPRLT